MGLKYWLYLLIILIVLGFSGRWMVEKTMVEKRGLAVGEVVDSLNGVYVYYNGSVDNVSGRNLGAGNYNIGLKYQCVEFVKRYYFQHLRHKMPDSYGHAKDFFDATIEDGGLSEKRGLNQYTSPSGTKPKVNDLLIFSGNVFNPYGHVAIVSKVTDTELEIIQQNPGPSASSRVTYSLDSTAGKWTIGREDLLGWLRKE